MLMALWRLRLCMNIRGWRQRKFMKFWTWWSEVRALMQWHYVSGAMCLGFAMIAFLPLCGAVAVNLQMRVLCWSRISMFVNQRVLELACSWISVFVNERFSYEPYEWIMPAVMLAHLLLLFAASCSQPQWWSTTTPTAHGRRTLTNYSRSCKTKNNWPLGDGHCQWQLKKLMQMWAASGCKRLMTTMRSNTTFAAVSAWVKECGMAKPQRNLFQTQMMASVLPLKLTLDRNITQEAPTAQHQQTLVRRHSRQHHCHKPVPGSLRLKARCAHGWGQLMPRASTSFTSKKKSQNNWRKNW